MRSLKNPDLRILNVILIIIAILLIFLTSLVYIRIGKVTQTTEKLYEQSVRRSLLLNSYYTFNDIEASSRGFKAIGDTMFLIIRERAVKKLPAIMSDLETAFRDEAVQHYYFAKYLELIEPRLDALTSVIHETDKHIIDSVLDNSPEILELSRSLVDKMLLIEDKEVSSINSVLNSQLNSVPAFILLLVSFFLVIILSAYFSIFRQLGMSKNLTKSLEESNKNLEIANKSLAEYIGELRLANEQLRNFAFIASHDLQEPLRKIQTFSNKLLDENTTANGLKTDLDKIRESAARMSDLILAISKYSRLQIDQTSLQLVDLNQISKQVMNDLEVQISEKKAEIIIPDLPTINCDPAQISQLFLHLISNSLKFCERRPEITIECSPVDEALVLENLKPDYKYYRFRITDNGIGFNNQYSDKLFVIFQRLHDNKHYPGTGLGLALCNKIVENHKGKITAYSVENEGTTFDIYLPANLSFN